MLTIRLIIGFICVMALSSSMIACFPINSDINTEITIDCDKDINNPHCWTEQNDGAFVVWDCADNPNNCVEPIIVLDAPKEDEFIVDMLWCGSKNTCTIIPVPESQVDRFYDAQEALQNEQKPESAIAEL